MITKTQVLAKLDSLKAYSINQDSVVEPLFGSTYSAVDTYFDSSNAGLSSALCELVQYMYNDLSRRSTTHEFEYEMNLPTNYPRGYNNIVECFYQFTSLLNVSNEQFFAAFVYGVPEGAGGDEGGAAEPVPISNSYLTAWAAEIASAAATDLQAVKNLAAWCRDSGGNCDMVCLLEDQGRIISQQKREQKARTIYLDRRLKEVVEALQLDVYIPTYLRS